MRQKLRSHKAYLWTLVTVLITVAIILVSTYLPGILWDMTFRSSEKTQLIALDLPNVEEIISPSPSTQTESKPTYYPSADIEKELPDVNYYLIPRGESTINSETMQVQIDTFSELVANAILKYFSISCSASMIKQHTTAWNVVAEGYPGIIDVYCSSSVVVQVHNSFWTITAYGSPKVLTHLSRTPASAPDTLGSQETVGSNLPSQETLLQETLPNTLYAFLTSADSFDSRITEDADLVMKLENYIAIPFAENTAQSQSYTIYFWLETYDMDYEMVVQLQSDFDANSSTLLMQILSISQTSQ